MSPSEVDALSKQGLRDAWLNRFGKDANLIAVIEPSSFKRLHERALAAPRFVLPLMRKEGFINFYSEYNGSKFLITPLERFQKEGPSAMPGLILHFYKEYAEKSQESVLMRGDVHQQTLSSDEAHILTSTLQIFHLDDSKYTLVTQFNRSPASFDFEQVMQAIKKDVYRTT